MACTLTETWYFGGVRAIFFDFMGTCLDWHTNIVESLPDRLDLGVRSNLAIAWREAFFKDIHDRFVQQLPPEDIDVTHARLLEALLAEEDFLNLSLGQSEQGKSVKAWHHMTAWPDVPDALSQLRQKYEVFVLANGTTRLQLDLARSSGLSFDMLFSSQLLGITKPDPEMYRKAMRLVGVEPGQALMVAAHAYDLRAASKVGMRTAYVRRWTEDTKEDMGAIRAHVDVFLGGTEANADRSGSQNGSLRALVDILEESQQVSASRR